MPLYLYEHSGYALDIKPFGDKWDSGQVGAIYATSERIKKFFEVKKITKSVKSKVENLLKGEIETLEQYMNWQVFGFKLSELKKCDMGHEHENEIESCYGFYGFDSIDSDIFGYIDRPKEEWVLQT